jgi:hypothetical protein
MSISFDVTDGEEILQPIRGRIGFVVTSAVALILGIACVLLQYFLLMCLPRVWVWVGILFYVGIILTALGGLGVPLSLFLVFRPVRLILGHDRYQQVAGNSKVLLSIPYAEISDIVLEDMTLDIGFEIKVKQIGVTVRDLQDQDVKLYSPEHFRMYGYHAIIGDHYDQPLDAIYEKLRARWAAHKSSRGSF